MINNIRHGWDVFDLVAFERFWCVMCTKARTHEKYGAFTVCLGCYHESDTKQAVA